MRFIPVSAMSQSTGEQGIMLITIDVTSDLDGVENEIRVWEDTIVSAISAAVQAHIDKCGLVCEEEPDAN